MEKSTIWTPANVVTILRVALVPAWLALAETQPPTDGAIWRRPGGEEQETL